ncbi:MAG: protein kinase [Deltaproteobacteria bacterium]|nr:protein kinase [Deltaproteobacteria bacterium]
MPLLTAKERINTEIGGRYRAKRIIGEGAFGAVFAAEHMLTSREVALKILHPHLVQTEQIAQRFLLEAQTMAKIRHPGICQVLDAGREDDGTIFLVLELLEGETLEESLERRGRLPRPDALRIIVEILDALSAAHARDIVHRDIKPANIFLNRESDGTVRTKLLDFGIAHVAPKGGNKITEAGVILGTPEYMPPEQAYGRNVGPVSDVWAVGIVLYEMFSGMVPWSGASAAEVLISVAGSPLTDIRQLVPDLPAEIAGILAHALEKNPDHRYRSAEAFRDDLIAVADELGYDLNVPGVRPSTAGSGEWKAVRVPAVLQPATARRPGGNIEFDLTDNNDTPSLAITLDQHEMESFSLPSPSELPVPLPPPPNNTNPQGTTDRSRSNSGRFPAVEPTRTPSMFPPSNHRTTNSNTSAQFPTPNADHSGKQRTTSSHKVPQQSLSNTPSTSMPALLGSPDQSASSMGPPLGQKSGPVFTTVKSGRSWTPFVVLGVAVVGVVAVVALGSKTSGTLRPNLAELDGGVALDPEPDAGLPLRYSLRSRGAVPLPFSLRGQDVLAFAQHLSISPEQGSAPRIIGTCAAGRVRLFNNQNGLPLTEIEAPIACAAHDLVSLGDLDGDGTPEVAAVQSARSAILVLSIAGNSPRTLLTVALPNVRALSSSVWLDGPRRLILAHLEATPGGASELVALDVRSGEIAWRTQGRNGLTRLGHPSELGLSLGGDVDGDGVGDIVVGATVTTNTPTERIPRLPRCVELLSGKTGRALWSAPFCQSRGGVQSVSLGGDINGDHHPDIAVGTDVARGNDSPVVLLSGVDGRVLSRIALPEGNNSQGFGWPVALGGDMDGDGHPELAVGSVNAGNTHVSLVSTQSGQVLTSTELRGSPGFPNVRMILETNVWRGAERAMLLVSTPSDGFKVLELIAQ